MSRLTAFKERVSALTADQWIITCTLAAMCLPDKIFAVLLSGVSIFALVNPARRTRLAAMPAFYITVFLLPAMLIPAAISGNRYGLLTGTVCWLILVFMLYVSSVVTEGFAPWLLDTLLVISIVAAGYGVYCKYAQILELGRVKSIFENPNFYGYCIELFILIALCRFVQTGRYGYLAVAAVNLACNLMCDCRTAWVAVLASVTVFVFAKTRRLPLLFAIAGAGVVLAIGLRFVPGIGERLTFEAIARSFGNRVVYWQRAWNWVRERPLIGYGVCSYEMLSRQQGGIKVLAHAHNLLLNLLLDMGVIGTLGYGLLCLRTTPGLFRRNTGDRTDPLRCMIAGAYTATLVHGIMDAPIIGVSSAAVFVTILATAPLIDRPSALIAAEQNTAAGAAR